MNNIFNRPIQDKSKRITTEISTKVEFLQPINKAFYIKENNNKYYLTDKENFTHKLSYKTALKFLGL